jgi:outer membrane protein assembly factor BamB
MNTPTKSVTTVISVLSVVLVFSVAAATGAEKPNEKKEKKPAPEVAADIFKPSSEYLANDAKERATVKGLDTDFASRGVELPEVMTLELAWASPFVKTGEAGRIVKGWVKEDIILLETDKHVLVAVDRNNGVEHWRTELPHQIRYEPTVSRNNVIVNCNNALVSVEKRSGGIRWKLYPRFAMSCAPLVIDPVSYPKDYTKTWVEMESIYVGSWDGRIYHLAARGRLAQYVKDSALKEGMAAPEFDLFEKWHKSSSAQSSILEPIKLCNNTLYYTKEDKNIAAISVEGEEMPAYSLVGKSCTEITVSGVRDANSSNSALSSLYVGSTDNNLYCLDRYTLRKKWVCATDSQPVGHIMADESATPYVYFSTEKGIINALSIAPYQVISKTQPEMPETYKHEWSTPGAGTIAASEYTVYVGLSQQKDIAGYTGISAVEKSSGKILWAIKDSKGIFTRFLKAEAGSDIPTRVFAITSDNRLVALKEKPTEPDAPKAIAEKKAFQHKQAVPKKEEKKDEAEKPAEKPAEK